MSSVPGLKALIEACGASHKSLALRINQLANADGLETEYSHTCVANWCRRGMTPKWPVPRFLAQAIAERLGRPVSLADIGMREAETIDAAVGLDFPRDPADAVRVATSFWSSVNRRDFLAGSGFTASAFTTPVTRWLITPADETAGHLGGKQVGRADLDELRDAADDARRWDSKYGGGSWKANSVTDCLDHRAAPRVLAFTRLIEARAHARARDPRAASRALAASEDLLTQAKRDGGDEPAWIDFYAHSRLSADAAEIFRDLKNPKASLAWNDQAAAMPPGTFTRSVGMRLSIVATAHLQARDLDHGIALGNRSVDILARVRSSRALDYVREFTAALAPWRREPVVVEFVRRTHKELGSAARPT